MVMRIAIVGPGRVGAALGRASAAAGLDVLGYVGRDPARAAAAAQAVGGGVLQLADLGRAHVVAFCVGDDQLQDAIAAAAAVGGRRCSLWLHTSGRFGLEVFAPAASLGVRIGALHPVLPFGDAGTPPAALRGAPAVLCGAASSVRLMERLCERLGLSAIVCGEQDRALYHAGLALAANGLTALSGLAVDLVVQAGGLDAPAATTIVTALQEHALAAVRAHGAGRALSGPVRRGDAGTVARHVERLAATAPSALPAYVATMELALQLAERQGLDAGRAAAVRAVLGGVDEPGPRPGPGGAR
ncbi:MAG: DUF2520 domain-containing protein [Planctomycetes bacterium]|nr:DUF2520 domain-containing protein [Planctomycetota bacterium]